MKKYDFDYKEYNELEKTISPVEEKVIRDNFAVVVEGNDIFEHMSSPEMETIFFMFRHGWVCRSLCTR